MATSPKQRCTITAMSWKLASDFGLTPLVTLHHFTSPRWLMKLGGWEGSETPMRFAAYCRAVMLELGTLIPYVCTINEANLPTLIRYLNMATLVEAGSEASQAPVGVDAPSSDNSMFDLKWLHRSAAEMNTSPENLKPFLFSASAEGQSVRDECAHPRGGSN